MLEEVCVTFGNVHLSLLPSPRIHLREHLFVQLAKVLWCESAGWSLLKKSLNLYCSEIGFYLV